MKIDQSVILITGGASGIGEAIARDLLSKGGIIYISDMNETNGIKIETETNGKIKFIICDVTDEDNVKQMIEKIKKEQGRIDIVINSAGTGLVEPTASETGIHTSDAFEYLWKVNTLGTFLVSKYASKIMISNFDKNKDCNGVIVMISSICGYEGQKGQISYAGSKAAVLGMTLPMARDLGKYKIRVNTIAPGLIDTPLIDSFRDTDVGKAIINATPLKILGKPGHIAQTVDFIIKCDFLNGTTLRVDGGIIIPSF